MTTPLFFIFTICVEFTGGVSCDYEFELITDHTYWNYLQHMYGLEPNPHRLGFVSESTEKAYIWDNQYRNDTIQHEIEHIKCFLEYPDNPQICDSLIHAEQSKTRELITYDEEKCQWFRENDYHDKGCDNMGDESNNARL